MNEKTEKFLEKCRVAGYTIISISCETDLIPSLKHWPFKNVSRSVFCFPSITTLEGWPLIWDICRDFDVSGGSGHQDQNSLKIKHGLNEGVYIYKKHFNKWFEIYMKESCITIDIEKDLDINTKCDGCLFKFKGILLGYDKCPNTYKKIKMDIKSGCGWPASQ
jgi:hypothetical protein